MVRLRHFGKLLMPSVGSGLGVLVLSLIILGFTTLTTARRSGVLYDLFFGTSSSASQIQTAQNFLSSLNDTILGNPILNQLLFFVLWMLVGLGVYIILIGLNREVVSLNQTRREIGYANARPREVWRDFLARMFIRWVALAGWGIYWVFFLRIYFPFSVLCAHIGFANLSNISGWLFSLAGLATLVLSLHLHVIFVRLIALRVRLFDET